jgi:hypothetical protein
MNRTQSYTFLSRFCCSSNVLILLAGLSGIGCRTHRYATKAQVGTPSAKNAYSLFETVPPHVRRIALLPISIEPGNWYAEDGRMKLEPILHSVLGQMNRFELRPLTVTETEKWTGKKYWSADEMLPRDFFANLKRQFGCDAVLFSHLSAYHPFQPLVVGWHFTLVDTRIHSILWAVNDTFDASDKSVASSARKYYQDQILEPKIPRDPERILLSPRRFGQFTLSSLLGLLPER